MSAVVSSPPADFSNRIGSNGGYSPQTPTAAGGYPAGPTASSACGGSARLPRDSVPSAPLAPAGERSVSSSAGAGSVTPASGPVLRKKLFDQNVADWASRYRKNKQTLDTMTRDCELLKAEVAKQQAEVDEKAEKYQAMEDRFNEVMVKFGETKAALEVASQQKLQLTAELSENRKVKAQLSKEKKILTADYERKHAELARGAETRDRLEAQLGMFTQQYTQTSGERQRLERELDLVQHNLRQHTELADEAHNEMERCCHGIKDSVDNHMAPLVRLEQSLGLHEDFESEEQVG